MRKDSTERHGVHNALLALSFALVAVGVFATGLFPIRDGGDQWWHLKTGKYLLEVDFDFPEEDVFSWTSAGHKWANHEWLSDTLMYLGYLAFGLRGLILIKCLILLAAFFFTGLLVYRRTGKLQWALATALLAAWASQYSVHLRPPVLTYLFTAIFLHLMLNLETGRSTSLTQIASFLLMVLWINLHGGAILGIVISGAGFAAALFEWLVLGKQTVSGAEGLSTTTATKRYGLNLLLVTVASLLNPFGIHIHLLTLKVMGNPELVRYVSELQMPNIHYTTGYLLTILLLVVCGMAAWKQVRLREGLLVLFFLHQSLNHVRHLPLFSIIAVPVIFEMIGTQHERLKKKKNDIGAQSLTAIIQVLLYAFLLLGPLWVVLENLHGRILPFFENPGYIRKGGPHDAAQFIEHYEIPGRMYNQINYSGCLIWHLSPETKKTFTDSRFDIFGSEVMLDCLDIQDAATFSRHPENYREHISWQEQTGNQTPYWSYALDQYDINFLVLSSDSRLHLLLSSAPDTEWKGIYKDHAYAIYLRENEENRPWIERIERARNYR